MKRHPDLIGIHCNNDTIALAAVEAVKLSGRAGELAVIGSDGTKAAYDAIRNGDLGATVNIFPWLTGWIGLEVPQRVSLGQTIPKVIETPQALVTRDNIAVYDVSYPDLLTLLSEDR